MKWIEPPSQGSNSAQSPSMRVAVAHHEVGTNSMPSTSSGAASSPRIARPTPTMRPFHPSISPRVSGSTRPPDDASGMRGTFASPRSVRQMKEIPSRGKAPASRTRA